MKKYKFISEHRGVFRVVEFQTVMATDYQTAFEAIRNRFHFKLFSIDK